MMWSTLAVVLYGLLAAQAVDVYLSSPQIFPQTLTPEDASAVLSRQLGLEMFEAMPLRDSSALDYIEDSFVGQGPSNVLLLSLDDADVKAIRLPGSLRHSFELPAPPSDTLSSVISTYLHRARHAYTSIHSSGRHASYTAELDSIASFFDAAKGPSFAAAELSGLASLRATHGSDSAEYASAVAATRTLLERAIGADVRIALLAFSPPVSPSIQKRADAADAQPSQAPFPRPPPQAPIGSVATCHTTLDACTNTTDACSGRGACVAATKAGRTCFMCACGTTTTGSGSTLKTQTWVGEKCERKDISGPFVLLAGTTTILVIVIAMSIGLLYSVGNVELPSVLLGGAVHPKKE
ncbi:hypothetical protein GGX14DRAFT_445794 [Mycena pura]|uniref:Vacuolar sorting protein Vps3844 C-terminal domain-containing protein n=1 Tax=Mycena pura TaxID=153505 RepID=A0AAD6VH69_9AGAR|nr:hypothetical protein GGX14DRAFT_445794 [Mycena pura]